MFVILLSFGLAITLLSPFVIYIFIVMKEIEKQHKESKNINNPVTKLKD